MRQLVHPMKPRYKHRLGNMRRVASHLFKGYREGQRIEREQAEARKELENERKD